MRSSRLSGADVRGAGEGTPGAARPRPAPRSPPPPPRALGGGPRRSDWELRPDQGLEANSRFPTSWLGKVEGGMTGVLRLK